MKLLTCTAVTGAVLGIAAPWLSAQESRVNSRYPDRQPVRVAQVPEKRPPSATQDPSAKPGQPAATSEPVAPRPASPLVDQPPQPPGKAAAPRREPIAQDEPAVQFSFASAPWEHVLQWFAELCGLSLQMDVKPTGTFNYVNDPKRYTVGQAMDVLNDQLVPRGFVLVRKGNYLKVLALDEGVPPDLIPTITPSQLDQRGESEFVSVMFQLKSVLAKTVAEELKGMSGPYSKVCKMIPLESANRLLVTDTAGNIRRMRDLLQQIDGDEAVLPSSAKVFQLKYTVASKVEVNIRDLLGLPPRETVGQQQSDRSRGRGDPRDEWRDRMRAFFQPGGSGMTFMGGPGSDSGQDRGDRNRGSQQQQQPQQPAVTITVDDRLNQIIVWGPADKLAMVEKIIAQIDMPRGDEPPFQPSEPQSPVVKLYRIDGDAQSLAAALATIYQSMPGVRFSATSDNALMAVATPQDQKAISQLIEEFERDGRELAVLPLSLLDATTVADLLTAVYASGQRDWRGNPVPQPGEPRVQADIAQNRLVVRASKNQIDDIRDMLGALGEIQASTVAGSKNLITIPTSQFSAAQLDAIQKVWTTVRPQNPIRVVEPGKRRDVESDQPGGTTPSGGGLRNPEAAPAEPPARPGDPPRRPESGQPKRPASQPGRAARDSESPFRFVSYAQVPSAEQPEKPAAQTGEPAAAGQQQPGEEGSPVVIAVGPDVTVIASKDPEALQAMLNLINSMTRSSGAGDFTVFYLKAADATQMATTLNDLLGTSSLGSLFSAGNSPGMLRIVPDMRTNALIVSGPPNEVTRVGQLLEVLDREDAPASGAVSAPRIIPVKYSSATTVANVIRDVYSQQIVSGGGPGGMRGFTVGGFTPTGFPGRSTQPSTGRGATSTLSIGVDDRSNSLVVSCSEAMFREIKELVETLDQAAGDTERMVKIVTIRTTTPSSVQTALNGLMGISTTTDSRGSSTSRSGSDRGGDFRSGDFFRGGQVPFGVFAPGFQGGQSPFPGGDFRGGRDGFRGGDFRGGGGPSFFFRDGDFGRSRGR